MKPDAGVFHFEEGAELKESEIPLQMALGWEHCSDLE
jgi:hypothetical protein